VGEETASMSFGGGRECSSSTTGSTRRHCKGGPCHTQERRAIFLVQASRCSTKVLFVTRQWQCWDLSGAAGGGRRAGHTSTSDHEAAPINVIAHA
jgi:hypothetical protein